MVFSSAIFLFVFFPSVFILYRIIPSIKMKNRFLILASLVFYAFGQVEYIPVLLFSVLVNYVAGIFLAKENGINRKAVITVAVIINLAIIGAFKYLGFVTDNINFALGTNISSIPIALPIGISFFTFQGISYIVDVYRDRSLATKNFEKLFLYISLFPQLVAGPIIIYRDISNQIDNRKCTSELTADGIRRFIIGMSKKLLIANTMGMIADKVFSMNYGELDMRVAWIGAICYTMQIYFDFSGYSDMAIGLGKCFGFTFLENFNYPYTTKSVKAFWRHWHISLSSWFRDYLYIPLGGNRKGKLRSKLNKTIVFFATGLWHGASWTFIIWGMWHGLFMLLEDFNIIPKKLLNSFFGNIYTLLVVVCGFVIFRAENMIQAAAVLKNMFTGVLGTSASNEVFYSIVNSHNIFIFLLAILGSARLIPALGSVLKEKGLYKFSEGGSYAVMVVLLFLCLLSISSSTFNPFIYFRF